MSAHWITPARTALLLIDFQVDFGSTEGKMARCGADMGSAQKAVADAQKLVDAARQAGVPVIFVRLLTHPGGESCVMREARQRRGGDEPELCVEGTRGADFIGPQPQTGEAIVSKAHFSAFAHTGLEEQLHAQGIDTLVLAGLTTECCVASSAWHALEHDFHVFIAANACAAYEAPLHDNTLRALALSGVVLKPTGDILAAWHKFI
jgi:ureidoacrylate peracid hydrolase